MTIRSRTVDTTPTLDSLLLGSADPARLRDWYEKAFGVAVNAFGFHDFGGFGLMPDHRDDVAASAADPGRVILNFDVPDAKAAVERIEQAGTTWIMPLTDNPGGKFATFTDPDGNYLQVIELSHDMQQQMLAGDRDEWRNTKPFSGIAVDDTAAAKEFYSTVMGLDVTEKNGILALWLDTRSCVLAYPKPN
ncbi:MAG: VOC family protein, partial [Nakamurella sp.]